VTLAGHLQGVLIGRDCPPEALTLLAGGLPLSPLPVPSHGRGGVISGCANAAAGLAVWLVVKRVGGRNYNGGVE
jgi:hypothetical protein